MDELDLFQDFRRGVAAPSDDARRCASARLASAAEGEQTPLTRVVRLVANRPSYGALALVALAGAIAATLFVSSPGDDSPGFLERAQAALTPPEDSILHMKWEVTSISTDPACTVARGPQEVWIDQTPPHRYRALLTELPPLSLPTPNSSRPACSRWRLFEVGGKLGGPFDMQDRVRFVPPNTLEHEPVSFLVRADDPLAVPGGAMPAALWAPTLLREAIASGNAHDEGETQLDGRTVRRIRVEPSPACPLPVCPKEPSYVYVDPKTFYPVQAEGPQVILPLVDSFVVQVQMVDRYLTFEYLPRTEANLALTDIRAQHPNAKGP